MLQYRLLSIQTIYVCSDVSVVCLRFLRFEPGFYHNARDLPSEYMRHDGVESLANGMEVLFLSVELIGLGPSKSIDSSHLVY